jgi:hypothetical protein
VEFIYIYIYGLGAVVYELSLRDGNLNLDFGWLPYFILLPTKQTATKTETSIHHFSGDQGKKMKLNAAK